MLAVFTLAQVLYDQLHILMDMYDLYTEKATNKCLGLLCGLWLEVSLK